MPIPLPNLDTRRWSDLVDEGRALIPRYAPKWTDHNIHDPGVTAIELLAWLAEHVMYRANRVPERHRRKFLALQGYPPRAPRPAAVMLAFTPPAGAPGPINLPAGVVLAAVTPGRPPLAFRTTRDTLLVNTRLAAIRTVEGGRVTDHTRVVREGLPLPLFGADPPAVAHGHEEEGSTRTFYLGFTDALVPGETLTLYLRFVDTRRRERERERLLEEASAQRARCSAPRRDCPPCPPGSTGARRTAEQPQLVRAPAIPPHHSVRLSLEYLAADRWHSFTEAGARLDDETRALTMDGVVRLSTARLTVPTALHNLRGSFHWIRCHVLRGAFEAAPVLLALSVNAVEAEQGVERTYTYAIAPGVAPAMPINVGDRLALLLDFDNRGRISTIGDGAADPASGAPELLVVAYNAANVNAEGSLTLPLVPVGVASGEPDQQFTLQSPAEQVADAEVALLSIPYGSTRWQHWERRDDLDSSRPIDWHFVLDAVAGEIRFGDGEHARVPGGVAPLFASYRTTAGAAAAAGPDARWRIDTDAPITRALLGAHLALADGWTVAAAAADPGLNAEDVGEAARRAAEALWSHERLTELTGAPPKAATATLDQLDQDAVLARLAPERAATALDLERLALDVPGTRIRRARAWTSVDAAVCCAEAIGTVTVIVVPSLPLGRPVPSAGLLRAIRTYLEPRRVLGTRIVVVGPVYVQVFVRATVRAKPEASESRVQRGVNDVLRSFLDPLTGGPARRGWPFGRDVYRSELLQVIDDVNGVDHVLSLEIDTDQGAIACGNVCVPENWLVTSGDHMITVSRS